MIGKNPARKIVRPQTRESCNRYLSIEEINKLLDAMQGRDRLVARICIVLGLRPGEVFAAKWDDFDPVCGRLRIDESAVDSVIKSTKTPGSKAWMWLPQSITQKLSAWQSTSTGAFFPSVNGRPISTRNFLRSHIWPAAVRAGIIQKKPKDWPKGKQWVDPAATSVNFRAFRRTCATWFHETAGTKNTQALSATHHSDNDVGRIRPGTARERTICDRGAGSKTVWQRAGPCEAGRRCAVSNSFELLHKCTDVSGAKNAIPGSI